MKTPTNIVFFMRKRVNLTQKQVSNTTGLTQNDLVRMEKGNFRAGIQKFKVLADFFKISVEALLSNDINAALLTFDEPLKANHEMVLKMKAIRDRFDDVGVKGEDWVFQLELEKLKDTIYANGVNPNFADDEHASFDILSFTRDGVHILVEVKTTTGKAEEPFYISAKELKRAKISLENGERYEVHRVFYIDNPKKRGRYIIPVEKLFDEYEFVPESYRVVRKEKKSDRS